MRRRPEAPPRRALLAGALLVVLLLPGRAPAGETDYLPDNVSWNGLSELSDLARGLQLRLELQGDLDWSTLPARSTLLIVYPRGEVDPLELAAFLGRGGRALVADDFGDAGPLLERLGIHRLDAGIRASRYHDGNPRLPVARIGSAVHALNAGVREVIANHPAAFRSSLPTLLGFEGDLQLLVAARVGQGTVVALSDPSVLINGMLRFEGNMTLATNLLRGLAPLEGNSLYLVTGHFRARGRYAAAPRPPASDSVARFLTEYNAFLGQLNDFALTAPALRTMAFLAGCLTLVALLTLLPLPRRDPDGHWLRPQGTPRLDFEEEVQRLGGRGRSAVRPALVLREELEDVLTELLEAPGPVFTIHPGWVVRQVRERWGAQAAGLAEQLLNALRQLPQSDDAASERLSRFRARDLAELHELGRRLLEILRPPTGESPSRAASQG